jgi:GT2 family glycosyltransferase
VYTGNASIRRSVFRAIGGFDERFVEYGNEDREVARRLAEADVRARMAPDAIAIQHYDKEVRAPSGPRPRSRTASRCA